MATKRSTYQSKAEDDSQVLATLIALLCDACNGDPESAAGLALFTVGLKADAIERAYLRALRREPFLTKGPFRSKAWIRFPGLLDRARKEVAEFEAQLRQRENGGTP